MAVDLPDRVLDKIDLGHDCWSWLGFVKPNGYGTVGFGQRVLHAHRVVYEAVVGPIPEGLELDHLCRVRHCVNPDHLEPVAHAENMRRAVEARTHCSHGHEFTDDNTYIQPADGARVCRTCVRRRKREFRQRQRAKRAD